MKTASDRLAFAVQFAGTDLDSLRQGDWTNLRDDLRRYMGEGTGTLADLGGFVGLSSTTPPKTTDSELHKLQAEVDRVLRGVVVEAGREAGGGPRVRIQRGKREPTTVRWSAYPQSPGTVSLVASGHLRDLFVTKLYFLLGSVGVEAVQECPACTRLFTRAVRHQKYCNRKCASKVNLESWLSSPKGKRYAAAQRKAARKRYERTVAEKAPGAKPAPYKPRKKATRGSTGTRARSR